MKQEKRNKGMTVAALVVAGLAIVGLAVLASDPFQRWATSTEVTPDIPPEAAATDKPPEAAEDAPSKATADTPADATPSEAAQATPADASASGAAAAANGECCKVGDTTPPLDLVKKVPPGGLHNPYDWKKLAAEQDDPDYLVKQFRLPGCNECHGGGGGGGMCPALSQGIWFWGNTDDVLFRLISLGSADLEK